MLQEEAIATHEAAHATISHFYGHELAEVEVTEESGQCRLPTQKLDAREYLIFCCAGRAANCLIGWGDRHKRRAWEASEDYANPFVTAKALSDQDDEAAALLVRYSERRATVLLERNWNAVQRLAYALLNEEKLSGEEVSSLILGNKARAHNGKTSRI